MTKTLTILLAVLCLYAPVSAQKQVDTLLIEELIQKRNDSIESTLHYKTGKIELPGGVASINIPAGFKFLESREAKYVIEDLWGNLAQENIPLGLIFPQNGSATAEGGYAFVVEYEALGYVKDEDADKIDYDELLKEMKEGSKKANEERKKAGLETIELLGWAAKPHYDKEKKVLYWAKELEVAGADQHTLNYDIRVLGRKGLLNLQAVSGMAQLDSVNSHIADVLSMVSFNEGSRYTDFDSNTDQVAAWTIGGLVAGKVLAKVGFFAILLKYLKLVIAGVVLAGGAIWRFITGRRKQKQEELAYESQAPAETGPGNPAA